MIRSRRGNTARFIVQAGSAFVNNRVGMTFYGSNCLDRRCSLRGWTRGVGTVLGKADATKARFDTDRAATDFFRPNRCR